LGYALNLVVTFILETDTFQLVTEGVAQEKWGNLFRRGKATASHRTAKPVLTTPGIQDY
jgi:hypothetical protein